MDLHTGDMPHACSHHAIIHVQAAAWARVGGGSQVAFALPFSLQLSGSLGTPGGFGQAHTLTWCHCDPHSSWGWRGGLCWKGSCNQQLYHQGP